MSLLRKIGGIVLLLLLPMGVSAQVASVAEKEMTVAERNAAQGFNDTIDRQPLSHRLSVMGNSFRSHFA